MTSPCASGGDEPAEQARAAGLNLSAVTQAAVRRHLAARSTNAWLASRPAAGATAITHDQALAALDARVQNLPTMADVVADASALVDLQGQVLHAPAHLDAEVLSALGRLHRAGDLDAEVVPGLLTWLAAAPIERHPLPVLLPGAWARRDRLRLEDAVYVELAESLGLPLVTTDRRLRPQAAVEVIEG